MKKYKLSQKDLELLNLLDYWKPSGLFWPDANEQIERAHVVVWEMIGEKYNFDPSTVQSINDEEFTATEII